MNIVTTEKKHNCPICKTELTYMARYPKYCCHDCVKRAKNRWGLSVTFANISFAGGFQAITDVDTSDDQYCTIDGVVCEAVEGRFGGIIVQPLNT